MEVLHERCAALDISKGDVKACVRVPNPRRKGARTQQVKTFASVTNALLTLRDWLLHEQVSVVSGRRMHLSACEAGQAAAAAGARRLLLSHFWPGNDRQASHAAAAMVFPGEVILAEEDLEIGLP